MRAKFPYEKKKKRVGCGPGSGHGKTACRGHKGQHSRTGSGHRPGFEGGQTPLYRRVPKRGFTHFGRKEFAIVNLERLATLGESEITPEKLVAHGVIRALKAGLKVLGDGELKKPIKIHAHRFSGQAKQKIEAAGGQAVVI
jgi:large subunit ribosomal protein L15